MDIAIIGIAGRFPGAASPAAFWTNLAAGTQGYVASPLPGSPDRLRIDSRFCDIRLFDPEFFGISEGEARLMDPQHRLLLECAHEALEDAGCNPRSCAGPIGVYAGSGFNHYFMHVIGPALQQRLAGGDDPTLALLANEKDFLASRIAYKLGLQGPAVTVQTACSTSLVAVHLACQTLRLFEADLCLAGGVSVDCTADRQHVHREGGILSRDGRCRPFDADTTGTAFADGVGMVLLKRAEDAIRDRDDIYAVIKGSSINNDGDAKVGYTAPSVEQYAALVHEALAVAGVEADSIDFLEAHGTGTRLGDGVELHALSDAFRRTTDKRAFCALGSVKSQVGHLDVAAGVTGLIKTALSLRHRLIPPTLHFETPNPALDQSPFFVNAQPRSWPDSGRPRRAAVSSLGIGGTNVHAVLEEAPPDDAGPATSDAALLTLSARSDAALREVATRLIAHLREHLAIRLPDVAYTLQVGRRHHAQRLAVIASDVLEAAALLQDCLDTGSRLGGRDDGRLLQVAQTYVDGQEIVWEDQWAQQAAPRRTHLPTYPFQRQTYWWQPRTSAVAATPAARVVEPAPALGQVPPLYAPRWTRLADPPRVMAPPQGVCVCIGPSDGLAMTATRALETIGATVRCAVDAEHERPLIAFLQEIRATAGRPARVLFAPGSTPVAGAEPSLLAVSRLARLLCETWPGQPLDLIVLTERAFELTIAAGDPPPAAPVMAAALAGAAEYPALRIRCVDVADAGAIAGRMPQPAKRFLHELLRADGADHTAFTGGYAWARDYADIDRGDPQPLLRPDGVYLITGGLGGVGLELTEYLAAKGPVRLALVTRRSFRREGAVASDAANRDRHRRLTAIEQSGAHVRVFSADAADPDQMERVLAEIEACWGPVNGVFHAAGVARGALMHNASSDALMQTWRPKGGGAQVLAQLFAPRDLDFLLLFSSTAAVFPAMGQLEYAAANMFLDTLAAVLRRDQGLPVYSVNWPLWSGVGMAAAVDTSPFVGGGQAADTPYALDRDAIRACLDDWAAGGWPAQTVIASQRPCARQEREARPVEDVTIASPADVEARVREIWLDLLGGEDIADDADFFDRGGDSIMAVQLIGRFRKTFGLDYSFDRFFAAPTIREMVAYVRAAAAAAVPAEHQQVPL